MDALLNSLLGETNFYVAVFFSAMLLFVSGWFVVSGVYRQRQSIGKVGRDGSAGNLRIRITDEDVQNLRRRDIESIQRYIDSNISEDKDSIRNRLVQAGFYSPNSFLIYNLLRIGIGTGLFVGVFYGFSYLKPDAQSTVTFFLAFIFGGLGVLIPNFVLDRRVRKMRENYRRLFPDFMDMMIVCTDAGLSIEAAVNRVAQEFLKSHRHFGIQLSIMMLEVRAGRRLREALSNFAIRLGIDEARSLATLFRQSEELGTSLTQALRTYSEEMRQLRIIRAEEKANALPVKMILPLAAFLFPVTMAIIVVPVFIKLIKLITSAVPG